jgi:hypothetical protein
MSMQRVVGIIVLAGGIVLIVLGVTASRSFGDQASRFFTGHLTENTLWYLIGGVVAAVAGLVMLLGRFGRR